MWESCSEAALDPELALFVGPDAASQTVVDAVDMPTEHLSVVCGCAAVS